MRLTARQGELRRERKGEPLHGSVAVARSPVCFAGGTPAAV